MELCELSMDMFLEIKQGNYITAMQYAEQKNISQQIVRRFCRNNEKCFKIYSTWFIPIDADIKREKNEKNMHNDWSTNEKLKELYNCQKAKSNMTKTEFAKLLGLKYSAYNKIENHTRAVSPLVKSKAITIFNLPEDYFSPEQK